MPNLDGAILTADALHLQNETVAQTVEDKNGHMLLGLKGNQGHLLKEAKNAFASCYSAQMARDTSVTGGHGRIETRVADVIPFQSTTKFPHISTAIRVDRTRVIKKNGNTSRQIAYYVATFEPDQFTPQQVQSYVRGHWAIENKLHHVKDRTMQEDRCQARANVGANMALLRSTVVMIKATAKKRNKRISGKLRGNAEHALNLVMQSIDCQRVERIE
jgi:predicted transposase YbfD/YdcC